MAPPLRLKYTVVNSGNVLYQRAYPTRLRSHPAIKTTNFKRSLGVKETDTHEVILKAWQEANRVFEDYIRTLSMVDTEALSAAESLRLARSLIQKHGLKAGMLTEDPLLSPLQNEVVNDDAFNRVLESGVLDPVHSRERPEHPRYGMDLSPEESVAESAYRLLTAAPGSIVSSATLLSECWDLYSIHRDIDVTTRAGKRELSRWLGFMAIAGDSLLTQESAHEALDRYVSAREGSIKGSSLAREMAGIVACIRHCIRSKRLPIVVSKPVIKDATVYEPRKVFTIEEHKAIYSLLPGLEPWKGAVLLVMLQTGSITTELQRLKSESLRLDDEIPHIRVEGKTKTASRKRYVPLVLGIPRLRELVAELDDGSGYAFGSTFATKDDSNVSHQLLTVIHKVSTEATAYSFRHTVKANAMARGVDSQLVALIGGWSGLTNPVMLGYGSDAYGSSETLRQLQTAMKTINSHLL